jgi:hypothetical protein
MHLMVSGLRDRVDEWRFRLEHRAGGRLFRGNTVSAAAIDHAIAMGSDFLARHQSGDGALRGFLLLPGVSTSWITAHVAFVAEDVPELATVRSRAASFLAAVGAADGGWAWNRRSRLDIDSTAQALLVLHRHSIAFDSTLVDTVLASQTPSGGFPTFDAALDESGGWQAPHPEVTAVVLELFRRLQIDGPLVDKANDWLALQLEDGLLPSYWWEGWLYGLFIQARTNCLTGGALVRARQLASWVRLIPDLPMVLAAALADPGPDPETMSAALLRVLRAQNGDGSWNCCRTLRVTHPAWTRATILAPGRSYRDRRRVFSTAHSVAALHAARPMIASWSPAAAAESVRAGPS